MKASNATLRDVARESGFSVTTVSHVLSGTKLNHASPRSREVIMSAAKRLNYRPNLNARQLVTRKSNIIGLLIDTMSPLFYRDVMMELERLAFQHDYRLQVGMVHNNIHSIRQYVDDFLGMGVQSVICTAHSYPEFGAQVPLLFEGFKHVVFLEEPQAVTHFPVVGSAHYRNHFEAIGTMLAHGFRRIVCIRCNYHDRAFAASLEGIRDAYRQAGHTWQDSFWRLYSGGGEDSREEFGALLQETLAERPEVVILNSDREMLYALRLLAGWRLRVPEDICLFSSESSSYGRDMMPSLAGFEYQPELIAGKIFSRLMELIQGKYPDEISAPDLIPAKPFWGESCPLN